MRAKLLLLATAGLVAWIAWSDYEQHGTVQPGRAIDAKYLMAQAFVSKHLDALMAYYAAKNTEWTAPGRAEAPARPPLTRPAIGNTSASPTPPVVKPPATPTRPVVKPPATPTRPVVKPPATPTRPVVKPSATPTATRQPTIGRLFTAEELLEISRLTHDLINEERRNSGLAPLEYDDTLAAIARKHSEDMARKGYFAHNNLRGEGFLVRYEQAGYTCAKKRGRVIHQGAENIFQGWEFGRTTYLNGRITYREWFSAQQVAEQAASGWMSSRGHRANILHPVFDREGVGVSTDSAGKLLFTQNFC